MNYKRILILFLYCVFAIAFIMGLLGMTIIADSKKEALPFLGMTVSSIGILLSTISLGRQLKNKKSK